MISPERVIVAIAELWRVQLVLAPQETRDELKTRLEASGIALMEWGDRVDDRAVLVVVGLDLSTAEVVLRAPPSMRIIGVRNVSMARRERLIPLGSLAKIKSLAAARIDDWIAEDLRWSRRPCPYQIADGLGAIVDDLALQLPGLQRSSGAISHEGL